MRKADWEGSMKGLFQGRIYGLKIRVGHSLASLASSLPWLEDEGKELPIAVSKGGKENNVCWIPKKRMQYQTSDSSEKP